MTKRKKSPRREVFKCPALSYTVSGTLPYSSVTFSLTDQDGRRVKWECSEFALLRLFAVVREAGEGLAKANDDNAGWLTRRANRIRNELRGVAT